MLAAAAVCALLLRADVYTRFERVRLRALDTPAAASASSMVVAAPDLAALQGQPVAIVARLHNRSSSAREVRLTVDGAALAHITVAAGRHVRWDAVADAGVLQTGTLLSFEANGDDWSLEYLELANVRGYSVGLFAFVVAPASATARAAPPAVLAVLAFVALAIVFATPQRIAQPGLRRAHLAVVLATASIFATVAVAPFVSPYRILLSLLAFTLCVLLVALPTLRQARARVALGLLAYTGTLVANAAYNVGGADSSGYLTSARWLSEGRLGEVLAAPGLLDLPATMARYFVPLGSVRGIEPGTIAPYYPPGLPAQMMIAAWAGRDWSVVPFLVSPLAAVAGVLLMYLLARELALPRPYAAAAALILALAPTYLYIGLSPMGDVVSTTWVLTAVIAALKSHRRDTWALLAGAAFGVAVVTRPANALLLLPLAVALPPAPGVWARFLAGGAPLGVVLLGYNKLLYGGPFSTGYGRTLFTNLSWSNFPARFRHYGYWIPATLSPVVPLGGLLFLGDRHATRRRRAMIAAWFMPYFVFYCCYRHYDTWWYTRFLLPAFPPLILALMLVVRDATGLRRPNWGKAVLAAVVLTTIPFELYMGSRLHVLELQQEEAVYSEVVAWTEDNLPENTALLAMQVSGAFHYYTDRIVLRWDHVDDEALWHLRNRLHAKGYRLVAVLFPFEVEQLEGRLGSQWRQIGAHRHVTFWEIMPPPTSRTRP